MPTFYDNWLDMWEQSNREREKARTGIDPDEREWVRTRQDHRAALLIAPETGFRTWGGVTMIAEIPTGCHSGKHKHGEEAIHILAGSGFSVIDGHRYDWTTHSTLAIPFGAVHQHFNTGQEDVIYLSSLAVHLEYLCGVHRTVQYEDCGTTLEIPDVPYSLQGSFYPDGTRAVLDLVDAPDTTKVEGGAPPPVILEGQPLVLGTVDGMDGIGQFHKSHIYELQRINRTTNGFAVHEVEMSSLMEDEANSFGGKHSHMEAHLFVVQGEGYTTMDERKTYWKPGSAIQIQGPQTVHQHVNTGDVPSKMIRVAFGVRYFFEKCATKEFPYLYYSFKESARP